MAQWTQIHPDMGNLWAKLVEGDYVEGWHVWALSYTNEQGHPWCTRCQDYHEAPQQYQETPRQEETQ